jgi:hypothetical protein
MGMIKLRIQNNIENTICLENLVPAIKGDLAERLNAEVFEMHVEHLSWSLGWLSAVHNNFSSVSSLFFSKLV